MRLTYDIYFEETDGSTNHMIVEGYSLAEIVAYAALHPNLKVITDIKLRNCVGKLNDCGGCVY